MSKEFVTGIESGMEVDGIMTGSIYSYPFVAWGKG